METTRTIAAVPKEPTEDGDINATEAQRLANACMNGDPEAIALLLRSQFLIPLAARALVDPRLLAGEIPCFDPTNWY